MTTPLTVAPLPNQVPTPRVAPRWYREAYHLTQLGTSSNVPSKVLDEKDPESGFGVKPGGPQGFLSYCKELESLEALPPLPSDMKVSKRYSANVKSTTTPAAPIVRAESVPDPKPRDRGDQSSPQTTQGSADKRDKLSFHFPRGSAAVNEKTTNRKSTPEFDRKTPGGSSHDGSVKKKKPKAKKKSDNERQARKEEKRRRAHGPPIIVKAIEDFPEEALKLIRKTKIPDQQLLDHLSVIVHIIRFRTGFNVRTEEEMAKSKEEKGNLEKEPEEKEVTGGSDSSHHSHSHARDSKDIRDSRDNVKEADLAGNSANKADEGTNVSRQKDKEDFDSDALDPSIVPRGGEEMLSDAADFKKMYKNLQQAGRGGFGSVFVAKSTQDKCDIAIKKLPHTTKKMKRTNFNEIGFLNSCKHSNIVKYYRSHLIDDEIWVVMEYMQGGTLAEAVERYSFAESSVAYVAREMLRALEYLHNHNLVHRDLKSANVMLTVEGKIKLIDFGLCVDYTQRKLCHMAGSPFWMPPEMILGIPHGTPADMWSFAICLLELANGEPPNRKSPVRAMFLAATEGIVLQPDKYSPEFMDFLGKCLQIDQTKRSTASELLKHPFLAKADTQDTMRKILAQIFISNAISNLDYGL